MKSLRQLLRRRSHSQSAERSPKRRLARKNGETTRRLGSQTLEQRQMLAGDLQIAHNYWNGYDVNQDLQITPSDALSVINYLATSAAQGEQVEGAPIDDFAGRKVDVNADGSVTPSDALSVINALARGEQMTPLVEYLLTARDADDNELPETNGVIQVGTGIENSFYLEVAYNDLRTFGDDLGAFSIFPDIGVSQGSLLQPVLRETQQIIIDEAIRQTSSGFMTMSREGSTETVDFTIADIQGGFANALRAALINTYGMTADQFKISEPSALQGENGLDLGFQIQYHADEFGNVDMPDLAFVPNFNNTVAVDFREFAPFEADGTTPNSDALRFNLDTRSRTLNDNQEFYNLLNRGTFSLENGFTDIGGVGGAFPRGVRDVDENGQLIEPFDAFRFEVFVAAPISDTNPLVVDVNPGEGVDPLTLYGSNDVVPDDQITLDEDARLTISTGAVVENNVPVLNTTPLTATVSEDDSSTTVDLLLDATDADNDTLSVTGFSFTSGDTSGLNQSGNTLTIDPSAYNSLKVGETSVIEATYVVTDGKSGTQPTQNLTVTITGANDAPVVTAAISVVVDEFDAPFNIDLLQNASDPDGDTLDAINIAQNGSDDASGFTVDDANNLISVDPGAYSGLEAGESITVTYDYSVTDNNGGTVSTTVSVTINGDTPNRGPEVSGPVTVSLTEDDSDTTLDLLTGASDPDGDTLAVANLNLVSGDNAGITVNGNSLSISPATYNALAVGTSETVVYQYDVIDGEGGSVAQTATITIGGVNDAPEATGPVTATISESDASTNVDLLTGASDPDAGDTVSVDGLTLRSGDSSGVSANGVSGLTVDPSAYQSLAVGQTETIIYDYNLVDGNGGATAQSATITITGVNDAPTVGNPVAASFGEDDASGSVDLLTGASDIDEGTTLSVSGLTVVSGDANGITQSGDSLSVDPSAYNSLAAGETMVVQYSYDVIDGDGGVVGQSATITINGANDAPTVSGPLSFGFTETDPTQTRSLLLNASDPDTSDTLDVANVTVTGDDSGITRNGSQITIDPGAYSALEEGQTSVITFTYQVTDGTASVAQTATVTISGGDVDPVVIPIDASFEERDDNTAVDLLAGASDPNGDPLSVIDASIASGDARGVVIDAANNQLLVSPSAYSDLEDGQSEVVVVQYRVTDDNGNSVANTATITIFGRTFTGSNITGQLYIDHVENLDAVIGGAPAIRNGVKDSDEQALGGVVVRLLEVTSTGETQVASTVTNADGAYTFSNVDPGTYFVEYDIPESVQFQGSRRGQVVVGEAGGETEPGPELNAIGLVGVLQRLDYLVKTYVAAGIIDTTDPAASLGGGSFQLKEDGTQQMFVAEEGFDARFAEIVLNEARDSALLTIINSQNEVLSAQLTLDDFVVTGDGLGVRIFGDMGNFDFVETLDPAVVGDFDDYRNAIDKVIGEGV